MSATIHPDSVSVPDRLIVPTCAGCGAIERLGTCEDGCSEQRLDLVPAAVYDKLARVRREAQAGIGAFRAVVEDFVRAQPATGQFEPAYRSMQYHARTVLHRYPRPALDDEVLGGPPRPAATEWCADCGGIEAPQQCLEFCIWRPVEWVTDTRYQQERKLAISEWMIESGLREFLRRIASITPRVGEWQHSWRALQAEAHELLTSSDAAQREAEHPQGEVPTHRAPATVAGPRVAVGHDDGEEFRRARLEGMAWARTYATADEIRNLVENVEAVRGGDLALDSLHWRGFLDGAEEVLEAELGG